MLIKLTKEQCARFWPLIKDGLKESLPEYYPINNRTMNNFLRELLVGSRECWVEIDKNGKVRYVVTLLFFYDGTFETKQMILTSLQGFNEQESSKLLTALGLKFKRYAEGSSCDFFTIVTNHPGIVKIAESFGAYVNENYINLPLKED